MVVDVGMPHGTGIEAARQILQHWQEARIVMLALAGDDEALIAALRGGARGLVLKYASVPELLGALRTVAGSRVLFQRGHTGPVAGADRPARHEWQRPAGNHEEPDTARAEGGPTGDRRPNRHQRRTAA